jgi:hypothetical protein
MPRLLSGDAAEEHRRDAFAPDNLLEEPSKRGLTSERRLRLQQVNPAFAGTATGKVVRAVLLLN